MDSSLLLFNKGTRRIHFKGFGNGNGKGTLEQIGINDKKREKIGHNKQATIDKCNNIGQYTGQYKGQWVRTMGKDNIMDCILFISLDFPPPKKAKKTNKFSI